MRLQYFFECIVSCLRYFYSIPVCFIFFGHICNVVLLSIFNSATFLKLIPSSTGFTVPRILVSLCRPISVFLSEFLIMMTSKFATNSNKIDLVLWNRTGHNGTLFNSTCSIVFHKKVSEASNTK